MATSLETATTHAMAASTTTIRVYNTLSKRKEPFQTVQPGKVGIYLCGPTVYKEAHIGHMVGPVIFDTIKRYLAYNGYDVTWVVNLTDVDDKLIAQSLQRGISMSQVATEMTLDYCANLLALGVDQISQMPRATDFIDDIIRFIQALIERGHAYASDGDVFFDVARDPDYGKLSNRRAEEQQGEGGGAASRKRSPGDFALWKSAKPGEPSWPSPWGPGRPGWHIECSAMSRRILGETFDIHGGGLDLVFPHHENEIAQSECGHGKPMARYWLHNGLLRQGDAGKVGGRAERASPAATVQTAPAATARVESAPDESAPAETVQQAASSKMSRSKGAGGLRGLITRQGGERIRFFLLRTHYRSTIVFSEGGIVEAGGALDKFHLLFERFERISGRSHFLQPGDERRVIDRRADGEIHLPAADEQGRPFLEEVKQLRNNFLARMDDDFNTGAAISELFQLLAALNRFADQQGLDDPARREPKAVALLARGMETLRELSALLGLLQKPRAAVTKGDDHALAGDLMRILIELRADARKTKNFALSDKIRDELTQLSITLEDRKDGTGWRRGS